MTVERDREQAPAKGRWDPLITELHRLREGAGTPSYETLTRNLIAQRVTDGQDQHTARIAKSSVHDAFRFGRSRINESLVKELVRVMDADPSLVAAWVAACAPVSTSSWAPPAHQEAAADADPEPVTPAQQLLLAAACVGLSLIGRELVDFFQLPIFLDMTGTAIAAIVLGPWRGAAVGGVTNLVGVIGSGWISLPFALVNITGALIWGYGIRQWGMGRTLPRFFVLNIVTALACSAVAVPVILTFIEHEFRIGHDAATQGVSDAIGPFVLAVAISNLLTSLGDKLISGFVALVVISALPARIRRRSNLVLSGDSDNGRSELPAATPVRARRPRAG
ncbi:hypothetical protein BH09ACT11_BH09ACT11_20970 [soil metagenome]